MATKRQSNTAAPLKRTESVYKAKLRWKPRPLPPDLQAREDELLAKFTGGYHPDMCEVVLMRMAEGHSVAAVAGILGIAKDTLFTWANQREAMGHALRIGQGLRVLFYELRIKEEAAIGNTEGVKWCMNMLRSADPIYRNAGPLIEQHVSVTNAPVVSEFGDELRGALDALAAKLAGNFTQPVPALLVAASDEDDGQ